VRVRNFTKYFFLEIFFFSIDATAENATKGRLINHQIDGNLQLKIFDVCGVPRVGLVAKENIKPGQELRYDYGERNKQTIQQLPWLSRKGQCRRKKNENEFMAQR